MVIDQNYVNRLNDIYEEAMVYGGKLLSGFYAGRDHAYRSVKNDMVVCRSIGSSIKNYEYSTEQVTDAILQKWHEILTSLRNAFKKLCSCQDVITDNPIINEYIVNDKLSQALVRTAELSNLTDSSGVVTLISISAIVSNELTLSELPVEAIKEKADWYILSTDSADNSGDADPDPSFLSYDIFTKIIDFDFINKKVKVEDATGFDVSDTVALYSPYTNMQPMLDQADYGLMGYLDMENETGGNMPPWIEFARDIYPGPVWYDEENEEYVMLFTVNPKPNLLRNPKLYDENGWSGISGSWSVSGNKLVAASAISTVYNDFEVPEGRVYETSFTLTNVTFGGVKIEIGTISGTERSTDGTFTEDITTSADSGTIFKFNDLGSSFSGEISNVIIKEKVPLNKKVIGIAKSSDLKTWTFDSDALISMGDDSIIESSVMCQGSYARVGNDIYFLVVGQNAGLESNAVVCKTNLQGSAISFHGPFTEDGYQIMSAGIAHYNGMFHILFTGHDGADVLGKHYIGYDIEELFESKADIYTDALDTNDSHFLELYSYSIIPFVEPTYNADTGDYETGSLYALLFSKGQYTVSGFKGRAVAGLMKFDPDTETWSVLNKYAPEILWRISDVLEDSDILPCASELVGASASMLKKDGDAYLFLPVNNYKQSTFGINICGFKLINSH